MAPLFIEHSVRAQGRVARLFLEHEIGPRAQWMVIFSYWKFLLSPCNGGVTRDELHGFVKGQFRPLNAFVSLLQCSPVDRQL